MTKMLLFQHIIGDKNVTLLAKELIVIIYEDGQTLFITSRTHGNYMEWKKEQEKLFK